MPKRSRKQYTRPRKTTRRVRPRMATRVPRAMVSVPHKFTRMYASAGGIASANDISGGAALAPYLSNFTVNLQGVVNASEFGNLYDQYRITYARVKFYLKIDPSAQTAATAAYPKMFWYRDYDDSSTPGGLNEFRENTKSKVAILRPDRPLVISWKPNTLGLVYQSAIANQFKPVWNQWLDCSTLSTTHYGFKWAIDDFTNTNYRLQTEVQLWFECRQPR